MLYSARPSIFSVLSLACAAVVFAACGDETTGTGPVSSSSGTGGSGGTGGAGGSGGGGGNGLSSEVCSGTPTASPFPGTDDCPSAQNGVADALDNALAPEGLTRCDVGFAASDLALSGLPSAMLVDKRRLPDFTPLHRGPLRMPGYGRESADWLDTAAQSKHPVSETLAALSVRRGHSFQQICVDLSAFMPIPGDTTPLASAIILLNQHQGYVGDEAALREAAKLVPLTLQTKLSLVIGALDHAALEVKAALGTEVKLDLRHLARTHALVVPNVQNYSTAADRVALLDTVDMGRMSEAAVLLAKTIEDAGLGAEPDAIFAPFVADTPLGSIVIHDSSDDIYADGYIAAENALLLVDLGGNDTYEVPAGASNESHPVAVNIDIRGQDHYQYKEFPAPVDGDLLVSDEKGRYTPVDTPDKDYGPITLSRIGRQGAGHAGIGFLFDLGNGNDTYRSHAVSQGFGSMGVGVLLDEAGDDEYASEAGAQGAAVFGLGALIDVAGKDTYRSFTYSQGFGGPQAAAALVDTGGEDLYSCDMGNPANGGHPLYWSPQLPGTGNTSMCQGAAMGRRPVAADDPAYMAGGVGILRDRSGKDRYEASVFAQGTAYWQGLGMLLEGGTDGDEYDGAWYIQGSTAHFALSLFLEQGGDDLYNPNTDVSATSIGVGHDFSASVHLDEGGNDVYNAPGLSLGSGNINGIGCLINTGGDDTYTAEGDPTLGAGNYSAELPFGQPRQDAPTLGIFVDAGGTDTYVVSGMTRALNQSLWNYEPQPYPMQTLTTEHGCGNDDDMGMVTIP